MTTRLFRLAAGLLLALGLAGTRPALAAPFTPGNLVVAVVGDGTGTLSSAAAPVFLAEYTPAGVLVQTVALPTTASSTSHAFTVSGSATSELNLTRSGDGRYLVLTGYDAAVGTTGVASTAVATTSRVVGRVAADGTINTSTLITDAFDGNNIRAAYSPDGSAFYAVGGTSGVRYVALGNTSGSISLAAAPANIRYIGGFGGNLYVSSGSSATLGISQIGTGLPTAAGQTTTLLAGLATATGSSPYAFYFADLSATVAGVDVAYVVDDRTATGGGIQKYSLVSGTWTLNGTIASAATTVPALRGLAGSVSGSTVTLAATATTGLYLVSDAAGYNAAPTSAVLPATPLVAAGTNTVFRGAALAPVAPATLTATPAGPLTFSTTTGTASAAQAVMVSGANLTAALTATASAGYEVATAAAGPYSASVSLTPASGTVAATAVYVRLASAATAGTVSGTLTVASSNATSQTITLNGTVSAAAPTITTLTPATQPAGGPAVTLTIQGTGFVAGTTVNFRGATYTPTSVTATSLAVTLPASVLTTVGTYPVTVTNPAGTSNSLPFVVTTSLATLPGAGAAQLALYPNPAHTVLTVRLSGIAAPGTLVELFDLTGRAVRTVSLPATGEVSVAGLPTGVYVLRVAGLSQRLVVR